MRPSHVYYHASAAETSSADSGELVVAGLAMVAVDINISAVAGTTPTLQFFYERKGDDGVWFTVWTSASLTATGVTSQSIGPGLESTKSVGLVARLRWVIGGTTPSFTFSATVTGK